MTGRNKKFFIAGGSLGVLLLATVIMAVTGRLAIAFKTPEQKLVVVTTQCGTDVVERYNEGIRLYTSAGTEFAGLDALGTVARDIDGQNYQDDPTCAFIRYSVAVIKKDHDTAQKNYELYRRLVEDGGIADPRTSRLANLDDMKSEVEYLVPVDGKEYDD